MPRKGAGTTIPNPGPEFTEETSSDLDANTGEPVDKPARRSGRKTAAERAEERAKTNGSDASDPDNPNAFEDWTRPAYADDPGEFEFGTLADADEFLSVLWWGQEGTGKTTNLARVMATKLAPKIRGRLLLINAEGGAKKTPLRKQGIDVERIVVFPKPGYQLTFESLERLFYKLQADLEADPNAWGAVGWDSITAIFEKLLDNVIEAEMRKQAEILQRANKNRQGRSGNITLRDRFETEGDDYAKMTNQVRLLLRKYRTLPVHFLVTALERRDVDKKRKGEKVHYGPAVNPALATALLGYVDIVVRTHVLDDATYYGRTTPTEDSRGKDRMFSLPVELVDPTFDRIYAYVHGEIEHESDPAQKRMPGGADGVLTRRSLDDELPWHTEDGTPDGPPLAGDEDDPVPPKSSGRRLVASSGRTRASAPKNASPPEQETLGGDESPDPPRTGGRKSARSRTAATAPETAADDSGSVPDSPPAGTTGKAAPPKRGGRKSAADRAAKAEVQADTEPSKSPGPATRAASERARKASEAAGKGGDLDEPPF